MVDLLSRPGSPPSATGVDVARPPGWLTGAAAGLAMAAAGLVAACGLAVAGWLSGSGGSMADALRIGADGWLLGHGSGTRIDTVTIEVVPLGLTAAVGWLAFRGGRWAARASGAGRPVDAGTVAASFGCAYIAAVLAVALVAAHPGATPNLARALVVSAAVTLVAAGIGGLRDVDHGDLIRRIPDEVRATALGALGGTLALFGCAAAVLAASLVVHVGTMRELLSALDPGLVGGLLLVVSCLAVLPNAVGFAMAVLLGPGVSIGTGTSVTLTEVSLGPMPAVPWFAATPAPGPQPAALAAMAALPLLCGVMAGAVAVRRYPVFGYDRAALRGLLAGVGAGLLVAALVAASGGAIGPGRMADVGPDLAACLAVAVAALGVGGLIGGVGARVLGR